MAAIKSLNLRKKIEVTTVGFRFSNCLNDSKNIVNIYVHIFCGFADILNLLDWCSVHMRSIDFKIANNYINTDVWTLIKLFMQL